MRATSFLNSISASSLPKFINFTAEGSPFHVILRTPPKLPLPKYVNDL